MAVITHSTARSESETVKIAQDLAAQIQQGDIILLRGTLGAGKTVFARALIRVLAGDLALDVPSPTFTLVQNYDSDKGPLWHFDLYRLEDPEEIHGLGWEDALSEGIVIVEWPQRLGHHIPPRHLDISLKAVENEAGSRIIEITRVE